MLKLLNAYQADRTIKNAQRIRSYERKHPMCACMLDSTESDLVADAIHHANQENNPRAS